MYTIETGKEVRKFLVKHPEIAERYVDKTVVIQNNPHHPEGVDVKPYIGHPWHYRMRIGKYRFLYEVIDDQVLIYFYDADSRGDIYR